MAAIVHRCACGHLESFHTPSIKNPEKAPCTMSGCRCDDLQPSASKVIPTWSTGGDPTSQAHPDPVVVQPGTNDGPGLGRLCDCDDCWALYRRETTAQVA